MDTSKLGLANANTKMVLPFLCLNLAMHAYIQTCMHAHIHAEKHTHMNACTRIHTHTYHEQVMGMKQCFSTSLSVPFPAMGMGLMGNAATVAWPLKSCTENTDCDAGQECTSSSGLGLSDAIIEMEWDPFDELLDKATCSSDKGTENKAIAKILKYFTGKEVPPNKFEFCIPKFSQPDSLDEMITTKDVQGKTQVKVDGLAAHDGVLPGACCQP